MANRTPYFFLAPTWDFPPPPAGPIQLGSVITSVKRPERPLYTAPPPTESEVFCSEKRHFTFSTEKLRAGRFGIFTRFLSMVLGVGADAGVDWESSDISLFTFDTLETTQFLPKPSYLQACVAAEPVRCYLSKSRYRKPVYVITGLKTVSGAKAKSFRTRAVGGNLSAEVDGSPWSGIPVSGGPEVGGKKENRQDVAWESGSDFVFAFRVRKVLVARETGKVTREKDYKAGAMLESALEKANEPEIIVVADGEAEDFEEGFLKEDLMDGDEVVICAVPNPEGDLGV
ncbi:hypothetical protein F5X96DRAFT_83541 [Biscogniauxia mediterranea]|nr:hypothetical protein F5X96DRAFT_83541 [Biscogniauxia mediterranea]